MIVSSLLGQPWEVSQTQRSSNEAFPYQLNPGGLQNNGSVSQSLGNNSGTWWQPTNNFRIPEMVNGDEVKTGSHNSSSIEKPTKRSWVPPQPPPVAMPEAAEAIRRPKPAVPRGQLPDDQKVFGPSDATKESVEMAKAPEADGAADDNGVTPEPNSGRIQEEGISF